MPNDDRLDPVEEIARLKNLLRQAGERIRDQRLLIAALTQHPVTKLPNKLLFDKALGEEVAALVAGDAAQKLMAGVDPSHLVVTELDTIAFTLVMAEFSHLKEANARGGRQKGDRELRNFASAIQPVTAKHKPGTSTAYHWGGNRFALIIHGNASLADDIMREVVGLYRQSVSFPHEAYPPNADFGSAMLAEALWAYGYFIRNFSAFTPTAKRDQLTVVIEFLRAIAEARAKRNKTIDRFLLLAEFADKNERLVKTFHPKLAEGLYAVTLERVAEVARALPGVDRHRLLHQLLTSDDRQTLAATKELANTRTDAVGRTSAMQHITLRMALRWWPFGTPLQTK